MGLISAAQQALTGVLLWLRRFVSVLLWAAGPPRHVAFIMDGNRRFATRCHEDKIQGHTKGYYKMVDVIKWCLEVGVECISVYAFSIENFKRSPEEVGKLMHLAEAKFEELIKEDGLAEREGVEVRVLGDLSLAPTSVQAAAARIMTKTEALPKKRAVLNICFSYTATQELQQSMHAVHSAVQLGQLASSDVGWPLLRRCLHTRDCPDVDLLIRTSGETRLSDFLLWQCSFALLTFIPCLWPDLSFMDFARCVLQWQRHRNTLNTLRSTAESGRGAVQGEGSAVEGECGRSGMQGGRVKTRVRESGELGGRLVEMRGSKELGVAAPGVEMNGTLNWCDPQWNSVTPDGVPAGERRSDEAGCDLQWNSVMPDGISASGTRQDEGAGGPQWNSEAPDGVQAGERRQHEGEGDTKRTLGASIWVCSVGCHGACVHGDRMSSSLLRQRKAAQHGADVVDEMHTIENRYHQGVQCTDSLNNDTAGKNTRLYTTPQSEAGSRARSVARDSMDVGGRFRIDACAKSGEGKCRAQRVHFSTWYFVWLLRYVRECLTHFLAFLSLQLVVMHSQIVGLLASSLRDGSDRAHSPIKGRVVLRLLYNIRRWLQGWSQPAAHAVRSQSRVVAKSSEKKNRTSIYHGLSSDKLEASSAKFEGCLSLSKVDGPSRGSGGDSEGRVREFLAQRREEQLQWMEAAMRAAPYDQKAVH